MLHLCPDARNRLLESTTRETTPRAAAQALDGAAKEDPSAWEGATRPNAAGAVGHQAGVAAKHAPADTRPGETAGADRASYAGLPGREGRVPRDRRRRPSLRVWVRGGGSLNDSPRFSSYLRPRPAEPDTPARGASDRYHCCGDRVTPCPRKTLRSSVDLCSRTFSP